MYNNDGELNMTYCVECILLENLLINFFIIYQVSIFTKIKFKIINGILGIFFLSTYSTIAYFLEGGLILNGIIKLLMVCFSIYIIFMPREIFKYIKIEIYYFLLFFMLVGIVISITLFFNINLQNYFVKIIIYNISGVILYVFNKFLWKLWKNKIKKDNLIYNIKIKNILIPAFVDTGNNVYDYLNNLDVIFIEERFKSELIKKMDHKKINLNVKTIMGEENKDGYIINNVEVIKNNIKIYTFKEIVFIFINKEFKNNEYKALLSYDTYIEKLKGAILC